jgi:hypothetical protein
MEKDQRKIEAIKSLLTAEDKLDLTESEETIEQAASRIYHLKKEIVKIDPIWRIQDPYNYYISRILSLLDEIVTKEDPNIHNNRDIYLKLLHETKMIRRVDQKWRLDVIKLVNFMEEMSKPTQANKEEFEAAKSTL